MQLLIFLLGVIADIWKSFVLLNVWNWFVPGVFGFNPLTSLPQAYGIMLVVSLLKGTSLLKPGDAEKPQDERHVYMVANIFLSAYYALIILVFSFLIYKLFM